MSIWRTTALALFLGKGAGAEPAALPAEVIDRLHAQHASAELVTVTGCKLGASEAIAYGFLYRTKPNGQLGHGDVGAAIAVKDAGGYRVLDLDPKVDIPNLGFVRSFVDELVSQGKLAEAIAIKCTHPKRDKDIHERLGKYVLPAKSRGGTARNHLCFQADAVYNSWVCYVLDEQGKAAKMSFVQLMAD